MAIQINKAFLVQNPCYKAQRKIKVKGLMLHSVGCPQPNAQCFIRQWNRASYNRACVHAFIDGNTGEIYQTLPWNHRGWHCGGAANNTHIGVEMCEPACIKYTKGANFVCYDKKKAIDTAKRTLASAIDLFAFLCEEYNLNPLEDGVIISHKEGNQRGLASAHADPSHLWQQLGMHYTMDDFRKDVYNKLMESNKKELITESKLEGKTNIDQVVKFLQKKTNNKYAVSAIVGNILAESYCNPQATRIGLNARLSNKNISGEQYTRMVDKKVHNNFATDNIGYGLIQWTYYTRKQLLYDYMNNYHYSIGNLQGQIEFLFLELSKKYSMVWNKLTKTSNLEDAISLFLKDFLSPVHVNTKQINNIRDLSQKILDSYYSIPKKTSSLFVVQAGAFSIKENAQAKIEEIEKAGYKTFVNKQNNLYMIQVGAFSKKENADNFALKLQSDGFDVIIKEQKI